MLRLCSPFPRVRSEWISWCDWAWNPLRPQLAQCWLRQRLSRVMCCHICIISIRTGATGVCRSAIPGPSTSTSRCHRGQMNCNCMRRQHRHCFFGRPQKPQWCMQIYSTHTAVQDLLLHLRQTERCQTPSVHPPLCGNLFLPNYLVGWTWDLP